MVLLLVGYDERAVCEYAQGGFGEILPDTGDRCDVLHLRRKAKVSKGAEDFGLFRFKHFREVAEGEFQRVIVGGTGAQKGERVGESAATPVTKLSG